MRRDASPGGPRPPQRAATRRDRRPPCFCRERLVRLPQGLPEDPLKQAPACEEFSAATSHGRLLYKIPRNSHLELCSWRFQNPDDTPPPFPSSMAKHCEIVLISHPPPPRSPDRDRPPRPLPVPGRHGRLRHGRGQLRVARGFGVVVIIPTGTITFPRSTVSNQKLTLQRVPEVRKVAPEAGAGCSDLGFRRSDAVGSRFFLHGE